MKVMNKRTAAVTPAEAKSTAKKKVMKMEKKKNMKKAAVAMNEAQPEDSMMALPFGGCFGEGLEGTDDLMGQFALRDFGDMSHGAYACQNFVMSSVIGPNGKKHVEKYMSSDIGNSKHKIREGRQAYSNSSSGMQKMALERQHGKQGRKMLCEKNLFSGEERTKEMFRGMDKSHKDDFDKGFQSKAHHLPFLQESNSSNGQRALPHHSKKHNQR